MRGVGRSINQQGDVARAKETLETVKQAQMELEDEFNAAVAALEAEMTSSQSDLEEIEIRPKKTDVRVRFLALVWLPFRPGTNVGEQPAWR